MKEDVLESNNLFLRRPEIAKELKASLERLVEAGHSRGK